MLTIYQLVNVPERGVDHLVRDRRWSITERLTDQEAEYLINAGLSKYFRLIPPTSHDQAQINQSGEVRPKPVRKRDALGRFV